MIKQKFRDGFRRPPLKRDVYAHFAEMGIEKDDLEFISPTVYTWGLDGCRWFQFWDTIIVTNDTQKGILTLDTGGWFTVTTKKWMNEALDRIRAPMYINQSKNRWHVHYEGQDLLWPEGEKVLRFKYGPDLLVWLGEEAA